MYQSLFLGDRSINRYGHSGILTHFQLFCKRLRRKQVLDVLYQVCVFRTDSSTRCPSLPLIDKRIFDFSPTTDACTFWISAKLHRKCTQWPLPRMCFSHQSVNEYDLWPTDAYFNFFCNPTWISTKLFRKQEFDVVEQVRVCKVSPSTKNNCLMFGFYSATAAWTSTNVTGSKNCTFRLSFCSIKLFVNWTKTIRLNIFRV